MRKLNLISVVVIVAVIWLAVYVAVSSAVAASVSGPAFLGLVAWWVYTNFIENAEVVV